MNMRAIAGLGLSALMLGGTMVGCTHGGDIASASTRSAAAAAKQASTNAVKARAALAKRDMTKAVTLAEAAVALQPEDAGYRALLGQAYLKSGRFASAHTAFADTLTLSPDNGKAALNLALAQIAEGQWDDARKTLDTHAEAIPASDRGLALALAGDAVRGVDVLVAATRTPDADVKTRQNLALAMALAGRWRDARTILGTDMAAPDADARIVQWAAFAKPTGAADQVASLLGVVPIKDAGQPVALALNGNVPVSAEAAVEVAAVVPVDVAPVDAVPAIAPVDVVAIDTPAAMPVVAAGAVTTSQIVPPVKTIAAKGAFKTRVAAVAVAPRVLAKGNYYIQLGAFDSAGVARDAWARAKRRYVAFGDHTPTGMAITSKAGQLYRLSVGGFARGDADALCRSYRAKGGTCFVRAAAGDQVASWVKPAAKVQFAAR